MYCLSELLFSVVAVLGPGAPRGSQTLKEDTSWVVELFDGPDQGPWPRRN